MSVISFIPFVFVTIIIELCVRNNLAANHAEHPKRAGVRREFKGKKSLMGPLRVLAFWDGHLTIGNEPGLYGPFDMDSHQSGRILLLVLFHASP